MLRSFLGEPRLEIEPSHDTDHRLICRGELEGSVVVLEDIVPHVVTCRALMICVAACADLFNRCVHKDDRKLCAKFKRYSSASVAQEAAGKRVIDHCRLPLSETLAQSVHCDRACLFPLSDAQTFSAPKTPLVVDCIKADQGDGQFVCDPASQRRLSGERYPAHRVNLEHSAA